MRKRLQSKTAGVITGASTGIGKALAVLLAKKLQARLVINARTAEALAETADLIKKYGGEAVIHAGDVGDPGVAEELVSRCVAEFASIEFLVNNAGLAKPGTVLKLSPADWERVFAVNFFAPLKGTYAALPHFLKNGFGKIVNISSIAGKVAFPGSVCYAASKFALTGMSEGMAVELQGHGIDVITVCPGWVRTEFFVKNQVADAKNPTLIAQRADLKGLIMKHVLSISSEQAAKDTYEAMQRGGGHEIILTAPGIAVERINALLPWVVSGMSKLVPTRVIDSLEEKKR